MRLLKLLFLIIILSSCSQNKQSSESFMEVNLESGMENYKELKLSSISDSIKYIPLETNPSCLLSSINQIRLVNNKFFIYTDDRELYVFSITGEFLNKIGQKGQAPGEYYDLIHFSLYNDTVFIVDYDNRIDLYKVTGEFIKYIKIPKQASRIISFENGNAVCFIPDNQFKKNEVQYSFLIANQQGDSINVIKTKVLRDAGDKMLNSYVLMNFSNQYDYTFKKAFNDTFYRIDQSTLEVKKMGFIDLGIHKMDFNQTFEQAFLAKHNMRINMLIDLESNLFIGYACQCKGNKTAHTAVYNKKNNEIFTLQDQNSERKITNDVNGGPNFYPLSQSKENILIGYVNAYECAEHSDFFSNHSKKISDGDNPVIVIVTQTKY